MLCRECHQGRVRCPKCTGFAPVDVAILGCLTMLQRLTHIMAPGPVTAEVRLAAAIVRSEICPQPADQQEQPKGDPRTFCNWMFKSRECGYTGPVGSCDKTFGACRRKHNEARFGGCSESALRVLDKSAPTGSRLDRPDVPRVTSGRKFLVVAECWSDIGCENCGWLKRGECQVVDSAIQLSNHGGTPPITHGVNFHFVRELSLGEVVE